VVGGGVAVSFVSLGFKRATVFSMREFDIIVHELAGRFWTVAPEQVVAASPVRGVGGAHETRNVRPGFFEGAGQGDIFDVLLHGLLYFKNRFGDSCGVAVLIARLFIIQVHCIIC